MSSIPLSKYTEKGINEITKKGGMLEIKSMLTGDILQFPAFLTNFNQSFASTWNEEDVYGRMDPIATFQNTKRTISLGFDLPAANIETAQHHLKQCNELAKFLYPGYVPQKDKETQGTLGHVISRPPMVAVRFANLISTGSGSRQLGWLSGLEWSPDMSMGVFTSGANIYPKVISLSFVLNVLHQGDKGWNEKNGFLSEGFFGGVGDSK